MAQAVEQVIHDGRTTKDVTWGDTTVTVVESDGWSRMHADVIFVKLEGVLPKPEHWLENNLRRNYGRCCTQTKVVATSRGSLGLAHYGDTPEELAKGFARWMSLPGGLLDAWADAVRSIDEAPGPRDLRPPEQLTPEEVTDPKS